jgi:hypothetical protein
MAEKDVTSFQSGLKVEDAFIELKTLLQSYVDLAGEAIPPVLFTLERAFDRFESVLIEHQKVLHAQPLCSTNPGESLSCTGPDSR